MLSKSEINAFTATWGADIASARRVLAKARLEAFRARRQQSVRRAKGLPTPDVDTAPLILPEVVDARSMREALLLLAEWSRECRVSWERSIEEERRLDAVFYRAMKLDLERLCRAAEDRQR
jgi:hypothetical protein